MDPGIEGPDGALAWKPDPAPKGLGTTIAGTGAGDPGGTTPLAPETTCGFTVAGLTGGGAGIFATGTAGLIEGLPNSAVLAGGGGIGAFATGTLGA
ncbi:MAG: hypothetical protein SGI71_09905 [Verrucomicrobiota bacterium]|nr:hypothetical protein [Verrucomicrobiota bacterium]